MVIEQFYLSCLAHASYMIISDGVAAVIDPQRDVDQYVKTAEERGARIQAIIETHLHADFVSGHLELAERTGAQICLGRGAGARYPHVSVSDGDALALGSTRLDFLATPGHTPESICVVATDTSRSDGPQAVFTGDTLFVGEVGRPDLCQDKSPAELASMLYDSLFEKLLKLPDSTVVYPAHGAGSMCGRNISTERSSTIGQQRAENYALRARSRKEFVELVTSELPLRPQYFEMDVEMNRVGAPALSDLPKLSPLSTEQIELLQHNGAVLLDTRPPQEFGAAHVPGAWNIALSGQFASWAGTIIGLDRSVVLIATDDDRCAESQMRLARVGIENVAGYLEGGIKGWAASQRRVATLEQWSVNDLNRSLQGEGAPTVLDVRRLGEWRDGHIEGAVHIPLDSVPGSMERLDRNGRYAVHCKSGYRSSIAASLLQAAGFQAVSNVTGGFDAWVASGLPVTRDKEAALAGKP